MKLHHRVFYRCATRAVYTVLMKSNIKELKLKGILGISLNERDSYRVSFYRYMSVSHILEMLKKREISFVYPKLWLDPYETKFLETDYSRFNYKQPKIYCLCTRNNNDNEEASWKNYANAKEPIARVEFNGVKLFEVLEQFSKQYDCHIYLSKVDYKLKKCEIDGMSKRVASSNYAKYIDCFDEQKYISIMSLKRRAFSYEDEWRIFIVPQDEYRISSIVSGGVLHTPVLDDELFTGLFTRFTFEPQKRVMEDSFCARLDDFLHNSKFLFVKEEIKSIYPDVKVCRSMLYHDTKKIIVI